jgi:hypothetical protein
VRLGWLTQAPTPVITRWVIIGIGEVVIGAGLAWLGYNLPMSGLTLLGAALAVGGIGTVALGNAMSQRTPKGAYVDAMLKAYRRTLKKTMEQARNMGEVVARPEVAVLADTPDKAVVWGIALGLSSQVAGVLERGLEDARARGAADGAYFPGSARRHPARAPSRGRAPRRPAWPGSSPAAAPRTSAACSARWGAWARHHRAAPPGPVAASAGAAAPVAEAATAPSERQGPASPVASPTASVYRSWRCHTTDDPIAAPAADPAGAGRTDRPAIAATGASAATRRTVAARVSAASATTGPAAGSAHATTRAACPSASTRGGSPR